MIDLHSLEAEHGVIGAMLMQPHLIDVLSEGLVAADFYWPENEDLYRLILALREDSQPVDVITLSDRKPVLTDDVQTLVYAAEIQQNTPSAANAKSYAKIIRERALARAIVSASGRIADIAHERMPVEDKLAQAQSVILALDGQAADDECQVVGDILRDHIEILQARSDKKGELDGLSTGLSDLDDNLQGLKPGQMITLAGRPAMGKTTLAMNIAEDVALRQKLPVLVVSLEMSKSQLMDRLLSAVGKIPLNKIKDGSAPADHGTALNVAAAKLRDAPLLVTDLPCMTVPRIRSIARRMKHKHGGMGLVVIDYIGLIEGEGNNRTEDVSTMSRQIKLMARELGCPVLILSQLNRGCESRPDKRPVLSDLRDSGAIEQDSDIVLFVYRDEVYHPNGQYKGVAEILVRKNRDGEIGTVFTSFQGALSRFAPLAYSDHQKSSGDGEGW
ncbi:replicative DNA helicase [Pseudomonas cavernicola]|uniref:Replicative DNA helicase n=1 Tax=Pseudomonas cavernicola TaxID=2320866 RepID=A0A418XEI2_9PSED|nr:replicative DNA helicase [Pseudomonas cavernicola]RJG10944.1 replicative DNA helicase [Pseudomonas cavernicola]